MNHIYTCQEICKQLKPCGNIHCSKNPKYVTPKKKVKQNDSVKPLARV